MKDQLWSLLWIRYRIMRNTWTSSKSFSLIFTVLILVVIIVFAMLGAVGLFVLCMKFGDELVTSSAEDRTGLMMLALLAVDFIVAMFLMLWFTEVMIELQQSEMIDFRKVLFLPVSVRAVFAMNFGYSLLSPMLVLFFLPLFGACLGLCISIGPRMLLGIPLGFVFFTMIAAWVHFLRSFLANLMQNKRRRRIVLVVVPLLSVLIFQVPYFGFILFADGDPGYSTELIASMFPDEGGPEETTENTDSELFELGPIDSGLTLANLAVPLGWFPLAIRFLTEGRLVSAGMLSGITALVALLGLALGYRSTYRFHTGASGKARNSSDVKTSTRGSRKSRIIDWTLPMIEDDTSAIAVTGFLTYIRHPMILLQMLSPLGMGVMFVIFAGFTPNDMPALSSSWAAGVLPIGVIALPFMMNAHFLANIFGMDHEGFRAYVLLPTSRQKYLLGKNIAFFPFIAGTTLLLFAFSTLVIDYRLITFLLTLLYLVQLYLLFCIVGNVLSLYFPYRIRQSGRMNLGNHSTRERVAMILIAPIALILMGVLLLPAMLGMVADYLLDWLWGFDAVSMGLVGAVVMLVLTVLAYRESLVHTGRLLEQREQIVLEKLLRDKE